MRIYRLKDNLYFFYFESANHGCFSKTNPIYSNIGHIEEIRGNSFEFVKNLVEGTAEDPNFVYYDKDIEKAFINNKMDDFVNGIRNTMKSVNHEYANHRIIHRIKKIGYTIDFLRREILLENQWNENDKFSYVNHLPFSIIDKNFIESHRVKGDTSVIDYALSNLSSDPDLLFNAVCSDLIERDDEYDSRVEKIYSLALNNHAPTFIAANLGTGKSTMLCSVSYYASLHSYSVVLYYSQTSSNDSPQEIYKLFDSLLSYISGIKKPILLCIDNPSKNSELLPLLYKKLVREKKADSFSNLHILFSDRRENIVNIFSDIDHDYSDWCYNSKIIILENNNDTLDIPAAGVQMNDLFIRDNISQLVIKDAFRKRVLERMITAYNKRYVLDPRSIQSACDNILYNKKSIADLLLEFRQRYNTIADNKINASAKIKWDWNVWEELFSDYSTPNESIHTLSLAEGFKYIAALSAVGIPVTKDIVQDMFGISGLDILSGHFSFRSFDNILHINQNNAFEFRHDSIGSNYFEINKSPSMSECLKRVIQLSCLSNDSIALIEKNLFSVSKIMSRDPFIQQINLGALFQAAYSNERFLAALKERRRLHSLEFAHIVHGLKGQELFTPESDAYIDRAISKSYTKLHEAGCYGNQANLWIYYFRFASRNTSHVPAALLSDLGLPDVFYKKVTDRLDKLVHSSAVWMSKDNLARLFSHASEVYHYIIENIDAHDIPSRLTLSWMCLKSGDFQKARQYYDDLEKNSPTQDFSLKLIRSYELEASHMVSLNRNDPQISRINRFIESMYEDLLKKIEPDHDWYYSIIASYARFQKERKFFDDAYAVLHRVNLDREDPKLARIYVELGMLCNTKTSGNDYYNLENSINYFEKARSLVENRPFNESLSVLKPLATTYLVNGNYDEAISILNLILSREHRDSESKVYIKEALRLKNIKENNLPVSEDTYYRVSSDICNDPVSFKRTADLIKDTMTETQIEFAEYLHLFDYSNKGVTKKSKIKVLYNIASNKPIPFRTLIHVAKDSEG